MKYLLSIDFGNCNVKTALYDATLRVAENLPEAVREFEKVKPLQIGGGFSPDCLKNIAYVDESETYVGEDPDITVPKEVIEHIKYYMTKSNWSMPIGPRNNRKMTAMEIAAEEYVNIYQRAKEPVNDAPDFHFDELILTVPVAFSEMQKYDIRKKIEDYLPDIQLDGIITEPFAGLFSCYDLIMDASQKKPFQLLVFDIGAGTLDMCIFEITPPTDAQPPSIELKISRGISLGGDDLTQLLYDKYLAESLNPIREKETDSQFYAFYLANDSIPEEHKQPDSKEYLNNYRKIRQRVKEKYFQKAQNLKHYLCTAKDPDAFVEFFNAEIDLPGGLTYRQFEELLDEEKIFELIQEKILEMFSIAAIKKEDITKILMIGGTSAVPYFKTKLMDFFTLPDDAFVGFSKLSFNWYNAVAVGACVYQLYKQQNLKMTNRISYEVGILKQENGTKEYKLLRSMCLPDTEHSDPQPVYLDEDGDFLSLKMYQLFDDSAAKFEQDFDTIEQLEEVKKNIIDSLIYMGKFQLDPADFQKDTRYFLSVYFNENGILTGIFSHDPAQEEFIQEIPITFK